MFFKKSDVINHRLSKQPRVAYTRAAEIVRKFNIFLSFISLVLLSAAAYYFLTEVFKEREAYFVKSTGEYHLIEYTKEVKQKAIERINERTE